MEVKKYHQRGGIVHVYIRFFKLIIIGIIAFIIIIVSSIAASDWDFTKDEFINTYNTFYKVLILQGYRKRKICKEKEVLEQTNILEHIKAEYDNITSEEAIFGGTALNRKMEII